MYLNVASGAFVRLSGSGLGCPDWPLCHGGPVPPAQYHAVIEFSNRAIALAGIVAALVTWWVSRTLADRVGRWLCAGVADRHPLPDPARGITVLTDLNPYFVMSHFLLAISVLGLASVAWARATLPEDGFVAGRRLAARDRDGRARPRPDRLGRVLDRGRAALGRPRHPPCRQPARHDLRPRPRRHLVLGRGRAPAGRSGAASRSCAPRPANRRAARAAAAAGRDRRVPVAQPPALGRRAAHVSVAGLVWVAIVFLVTRVVARRAVVSVDAVAVAAATG